MEVSFISEQIEELDEKVTQLDEKLDKLLELLQDVKPSCDKMKSHIDFIEAIYENVKNPLGYFCNFLKMYSYGTNYSLEDK